MALQKLDLAQAFSPEAAPKTAPDSDGWLADNVLHPFINGTGVIQIYDTIADKEAKPLHVEDAPPLTLDWGVQALSGAAGAILPYVAAAAITRGGLRTIGSSIGAQGMAGAFFASEAGAQIIGAGLYDFAKKPFAGETRVGNAAGVMAGFAVFGIGNQVAPRLLPEVASSFGNFGLQGAGRFAVGAVGGLTSYEVSNRTSNALGQHNELSWDGRWKSMASGGFINFGLPLAQEGAQRLVDKGNVALGRGLAVDRYLKYSRLAIPNCRNWPPTTRATPSCGATNLLSLKKIPATDRR